MLNVHELPYLTADIPGVGGTIKQQPSDFVVDELPLYEASGEGTHVYFRIRKTGLSTMQAIQHIARALGRAARDIGYAGLKDADAVTTQMLSLEHIDPARIESLQLPRIEVVSVSRHRNKLKLGHLAGNRFAVRLRDVDPSVTPRVKETLELLTRRGVPNYFGPQRFGARGDTWEIGRAMLRGDHEEAVRLMVGRAGPHDYGQVRAAREFFDRGEYEQAAQTWPYPFNHERRICWAVVKAGGNVGKAFRAVEPQMRRFYVSAYQSQFFNQVVAHRIGGLDRLMAGDLAWRHANGAVFRVEDVEREQPRCTAFEISPSGPLFGERMSDPQGEPGEIERQVLAEEGLTPEAWKQGPHRATGGRRPLRFQPRDSAVEAGQDDSGPFVVLHFSLESGCYATTVLREICKAEVTQTDAPAAETEE